MFSSYKCSTFLKNAVFTYSYRIVSVEKPRIRIVLYPCSLSVPVVVRVYIYLLPPKPVPPAYRFTKLGRMRPMPEGMLPSKALIVTSMATIDEKLWSAVGIKPYSWFSLTWKYLNETRGVRDHLECFPLACSLISGGWLAMKDCLGRWMVPINEVYSMLKKFDMLWTRVKIWSDHS